MLERLYICGRQGQKRKKAKAEDNAVQTLYKPRGVAEVEGLDW